MGGLAKKLIASAGGEEKQYVDDVFSTTLYTGNGSTQTINNGIDLAGKGGLVWIKERTRAGTRHSLFDTVRGRGSWLSSDGTEAAQAVPADKAITSFNSDGFSLGPSYYGTENSSGQAIASWTFRKAPKFFDVVTYTGNGIGTTRNLNHSLGVAPGMIILKRLDIASSWPVYHRSLSQNVAGISLESTSAGGINPYQFGNTSSVIQPTASVFTVGADWNVSGATYVAYLFAHDTSADGIIQCGSFTNNASVVDVTLGWEPQWILYKNASQSTGWNWAIVDNMRGWANGGPTANDDAMLFPNLSNSEVMTISGTPTATGFRFDFSTTGTDTFIYLAIRRPNKPPKSGTEVFAASSVATLADYAVKKVALPFSPDVVFSRAMSTGTDDKTYINSRLVGQKPFDGTTSLLAEDINSAKLTSESDAVFTSGSPTNSIKYFHAFKRAVGFMDEVSYTGDGTTYRLINHNLKATPEFIINILGNSRAQAYHYYFGTGVNIDIGGSNGISYRAQGDYIYNEVTSSYFKFDRSYYNNSGVRYTTLLFASLTGVSKVGVYTGNGSTQIIDCGFSTGARYIFIQRADTYATVGNNVLFTTVFDFHRGIVSGDDKYFSYSTPMIVDTSNTAYYGEPPVVDAIDPHSSGFIINNQSTTLLNVTGGSYIFLAIA